MESEKASKRIIIYYNDTEGSVSKLTGEFINEDLNFINILWLDKDGISKYISIQKSKIVRLERDKI